MAQSTKKMKKHFTPINGKRAAPKTMEVKRICT
jgi:hypothetical protein